MTSSKALAALLVQIALAVIGLCLAAGLDISDQLQHAITTFIEVTTPVAVLVVGWLHHGRTKVAAAAKLAAGAIASSSATTDTQTDRAVAKVLTS